jgi:hypothetical protein
MLAQTTPFGACGGQMNRRPFISNNHFGKIDPATVPARPAHAFPAHPTRFERVTFAFGALLLPPPSPRGAVAEPEPIG